MPGIAGAESLISPGGVTLTIPGVIYDGVSDNWSTIQTYLNTLGPVGGVTAGPAGGSITARLASGLVAISKPLVIPSGVAFGGSGSIAQALDAGSSPNPPTVGTSLIPVAGWVANAPSSYLTAAITGGAGTGVITPASTSGFGTSGTYLITGLGGWTVGTFTGNTGTTLTGCTQGAGFNTWLSAPIVLANPITAVTQSGSGPFTQTVTTTNPHGFYDGEPVVVAGNVVTGSASTPTYQSNGTWAVHPVPGNSRQFTFTTLGDTLNGGTTTTFGACAPCDAMTVQSSLYTTIFNMNICPGSTVQRGNIWGWADSWLEKVFITGGTVACHDSDSNVPANSTRSVANFCYFFQPASSKGYSFYEWGNNWRVTQLYKTGGTAFLKGGNCIFMGGRFAGGGGQLGPAGYNTRILKNDFLIGTNFDSFFGGASGLVSNETTGTSPATLIGVTFYNSVSTASGPAVTNTAAAVLGMKVIGNADSSAAGPFTCIVSNPLATDVYQLDASTLALNAGANPEYIVGGSGLTRPGIVLPHINNGVAVAPRTGTAVLVAGTVAVTGLTAITANASIRLSYATRGGTAGAVFVSAITAGTGFTITSTNAADTSTIYWEVIYN